MLAKPGNRDLAQQDGYRRQDAPARDPAGGDQQQERGRDQQLVGDRVEHAAQRRGLVQPARQIAVQPVGGGGGQEQRQRQPPGPDAVGQEQQGEGQDQKDPACRQQIGQIKAHLAMLSTNGLST